MQFLAAHRIIIALFCASISSLSYAADNNEQINILTKIFQGSAVVLSSTKREPSQFSKFLEQIKTQARREGISETTINNALGQAQFITRAVKSDKNQLEKKITLDVYLNRVLTAQKIKQARIQYKKYQTELMTAGANSGVAPNYIAALWAMESHFGKIQGKEDVISALASLAFDGRREDFFRQELIAALRILDKGYITLAQMKGSWAGAMGQCQFMPGSYLRYGKDGDGDGKIDIWKNTRDVFASTANYLATEGWDSHSRWGDLVTLPENFDQTLAGINDSQKKTLSQWQALGVVLTDKPASAENNRFAWVIIPEDNKGRTYLVYENFRTIMHWNRSYYFAISIGMMADAIAQ